MEPLTEVNCLLKIKPLIEARRTGFAGLPAAQDSWGLRARGPKGAGFQGPRVGTEGAGSRGPREK